MYKAPLIGRSQRFAAANTTVIGRVSSTVAAQPNINIIGVMTHMSVPDKTTIQVWAGTTATATAAGVPITGLVTFTSGGAVNRFLPLPAYCSGGAVIDVIGQSDVTIFWNPAGG